MATTRCIDDTHALVAGYCWRTSMAHDSSDGGLSIDDFHTLRERVTVMRADYQHLLTDRDYLLKVGKMYHRALREKEIEVDSLMSWQAHGDSWKVQKHPFRNQGPH
jgi:hypothetical protein